MTRTLAVAVFVFVACGSPSGTDGGSGGAAGGGSGGAMGGASGGGSGGSTGGAGGGVGGGVVGGGAGGGALVDGGSTTLTGPLAFVPVATRTSLVGDGGFVDAVVTVAYDKQPITCNTSPNTPFAALQIRVRNPDGGSVTTGTYGIDGTFVKVARDEFLTIGQGLDGGEATSGSVTITRLEPGRSSGTFSATLTQYNLMTSSLSGSWDSPVCR